MKSSPFARAMLLMQAIANATSGVDRQIAIQMAGGYRSRGHGKGTYGGKKQGNHGTNWKGHMNSEREVARRQRQIAKGMLHVSA